MVEHDINNSEESQHDSTLAPTPTPAQTPTPRITIIPSITFPDYKKSDNRLDPLIIDYERNITELRKEKDDLLKSIQSNQDQNENQLRILYELNDSLASLNSIGYLISQLHPQFQTVLLKKNNKLISIFNSDLEQKAYILSIDIRRSTELMLKCRTAKLYSNFIIELCEELKFIITTNYGVYDKFTGDGILAFYPEFLIGKIACKYKILKSAFECIKKFDDVYQKHRSSFNVVLSEVGIGIGIDYGEVSIVNFNNYYSAVGSPVIYACRLSSTKAGTVAINQSAYNEIIEYDQVTFSETTLEIKNEGLIKVYIIEAKTAFSSNDETYDNIIRDEFKKFLD